MVTLVTSYNGCMKNHYQIIKPTGRHKSYRILKQWTGENGKRQSETVSMEPVDAVNLNLMRGQIDVLTAEKNLNSIVKDLRIAAGEFVGQEEFHNDNQKLLDDYFNKVYRRRDVIDKDTEYHSLTRAIRSLGNLSLYKATEDQIQDQVDKHFAGNKQRRIISKLILLLKFINRPEIKLLKKRPERRSVNYLTEAELQQVLLHLSPAMRTVTKLAFYTGCRTGECFALTGHHNDRVITIGTQIDRSGNERETKNRRVRTTVIGPKAIPILEAWADERDKFPYPRTQISRLFKAACMKAFPGNKNKILKFHDLRHSYAIDLLNKGATIEEVAASLGDSVGVAQEHYTGFVLTSGATERLKRLTST